MWPFIFLVGMVWLISRNSSVGLAGVQKVPQLPGGAGIVQTAGLMKAMINQAISHPIIRKQAAMVTEGIDRNNQKEKAVAIGEWVRRKVRYVSDPLREEHLTNPATFAQAIDQGRKVYGDCDDMSMYAAALGKSIGLNPVLKIVGRNKRYHHVYVMMNGVPVDCTVSFGTKPFNPQREMTIEV